MAITLKDIALGNKRMADQPFTSYRPGAAQAAMKPSASLNDLKSIADALKAQQAPDLSEREIENNRMFSKIQDDVAYLPKIYKEVSDMNRSLKKTMFNIADTLKHIENNAGSGGLLSGLLGAGAGAGLYKLGKGAGKAAKYSPKGRIIPKIGTYAGELVKDVKLAGKQLKGIGGKAIDEGVKLTKKAATGGASKWKPFMSWLEKRSPKVFAKVGARILAAGAGLALPGPGWVWTAVSVIGSLSLAYEVYQLWQEYKKSTPTQDDKPPKAEQDAKKPKVLKEKDAPAETTVTKTEISGKVAGDKADGPITKDGKTYNPGDPGYDEAEKELVAANKKMRDRKEEIEKNAADRTMGRGKYAKKPSKFTEAMNAVKGFFGVKPKKDTMDFESEETKDWGDVPVSDQEAKKYAGAFAKGGKIPAGKKGVVGEAGPELVEGPASITPTKDWLKQNYKTAEEFWTANTEGQGMGGKIFQDLDMAYMGQEFRRKKADPKYKSPGKGDEWERIIRYLSTPEGRAFQYKQALGTTSQFRALDEAYRQKDLKDIEAGKDSGDIQGPKVDPSKTTMTQALYDESRGAVNFGDKGKIKEVNAIELAGGDDAIKISNMSSENDMAKLNTGKSNSQPAAVVSAPTVVNNSNQTNVIKTPVRNQDASYADYQRSKYAS